MEISLSLIRTEENFDILDVKLLQDKINYENVLSNLQLPEVNKKKGVIINGRGPIWLYIHLYRNLRNQSPIWIASYAPQDGGAVVIESGRDNIKFVPTSKLLKYISIP